MTTKRPAGPWDEPGPWAPSHMAAEIARRMSSGLDRFTQKEMIRLEHALDDLYPLQFDWAPLLEAAKAVRSHAIEAVGEHMTRCVICGVWSEPKTLDPDMTVAHAGGCAVAKCEAAIAAAEGGANATEDQG